MGRTRKSSKALVSTLSRAEDAAEEEILETPAVSRLHNAGSDNERDSDDDEADAKEEDEAEIERRLVAEALAEQEAAKNERENKGIYNREALQQILDGWSSKKPALPWLETLETCQFPLDEVNVHDDLKREVAFYSNALQTVRFAKDKLKAMGVAYKRPDDYFAEMLKSDAHMAKVKDKLIYEQKKIHAVEERKKSQAHRKVAKELQSEKVKQRLQQKKDTLDAVKEWKKRRSHDKGGAIRDDDDKELDAIVSGKTPVSATGKRKRDDRNGDRDGDSSKKPRVNKKREGKDKKFGFGGKKKHIKTNTRDSTNDMSGYPGRKMRAQSGKAPKAKRAGKAARTQKRGAGKR